MKILMLGWEFPPKHTGGLGVASQGLAQALAGAGHEVTFIIPKYTSQDVPDGIKLVDASTLEPAIQKWMKVEKHVNKITFLEIGTSLLPYLPPEVFERQRDETKTTLTDTELSELMRSVELTGNYYGNLQGEIRKFALLVADYASEYKFDLIHAHDWMTFPAAAAVKEVTSTPVIAHIHSIEYDRNGPYSNSEIIEIEKAGLSVADHIITVSSIQKNLIETRYDISSSNITVIPNATPNSKPVATRRQADPIIGYVGRMVDQKGPGRFVDIAHQIYNVNSDISFVMAGDGYLLPAIKEKISRSNLNDQITIAGFLTPEDTWSLIASCDLIIMPSTSEPFGLVALEAASLGVPVLISENAGVCEYLPSLIKLPNWDTFNFTRQAIELMKSQSLRSQIGNMLKKEAAQLSWQLLLPKVTAIYENLN
jgi:glycogen(starch) synthase